MTSYEDFCAQYRFHPELSGMVGVERECFILESGRIVPYAAKVLERLCAGRPDERFTFELSACQLETRVGPVDLGRLSWCLREAEAILAQVLIGLGLTASHNEVAPPNMPLDVFPDPTGRYQRIVATLPKEKLLAGCRIIGTHFHYGMSSPEEAVAIYNRLVPRVRELCEMGDGSSGQRIKIYEQIAPHCWPQPIRDWRDFYRQAQEQGFVDDPRSNWGFIRISRHGTVEVRTAGTTASIPQVVKWARRGYELCFST